MSTKYIIFLVFISLGIAIMVMSYGSSSTYRCFNDAAKSNDEFHVVGKLNKEKPQLYNPLENVNRFIFFMSDSCGSEKAVVYNQPKPNDFDKSDKIVVIGRMKNDSFTASQILLKCPSKYNE